MAIIRGARELAERERSRFLADHHVERQDSGTVLREITRIGSGLSFLGSRALAPNRRDPALTPVPPGRPHSGYGSADGYISDNATEHAVGSAAEGTRVWWFMPDRLADGDSAPVVVYLHGFRASAPDLYWEHIHHLTRQGIIVVFPRINKGGPTGLFTDNDQPSMITRAVESARVALDEIGDKARTDELYLFGHSLGGLIGACWHGFGGPPAKAVVLAHPSISLERIPAFARKFITAVDWRTHAAVATQRTVILGGDKDTLVPVAECLELAAGMKKAESCVVHITHHDEHGTPPIPAGHLATVRADSPAIRWLGHVLGGNEGDDTLHSRFYYAALDAVMAGEEDLDFDMGNWSDGKAVLEPTVDFDSRSADGAGAARPPGRRQ